MNGIARRLLGGGLGSSSKESPQPVNEPQSPPQPPPQPSVAPLAIGGKSGSGSWKTPASILASARSMTSRSDDSMSTPVAPTPAPTSPPNVTDDNTIRQRPVRTTSTKSGSSASVVTPQTTMSPPPAFRAPTNARPAVNTNNVAPKPRTGTPNGAITKDELLLSLLASEAVVDSRDSEILSAEQVEELKKEDVLLQSRYASSTKKLALETKMRDAARSLAALNSQNKSMSKQTQEQLDVATRRLESAQADHARVRERATEVQRKLLEHRAGVLSAALRRVEDDSSEERSSFPSSKAMSPATATSATSVSVLSKFDGAHLFAGHANAVSPANVRSVSNAEVEALQERVTIAEESAKAATKRAAELGRDLGLLKLEMAEAETTAALEVQQAEEQVAELRRGLVKAEKGQAQGDAWLKERGELLEDVSQRDQQIEKLLRQVETLEGEAGERRRDGQAQSDEEVEAARQTLRAIVRSQRINVRATPAEAEAERRSIDSSVYSVTNMAAAIASHVESLDEAKKALEKGRREAELQLRDEQDAREKLVRQLDESRQDTDESLRRIAELEHQMQEQSNRIIELSRSESSGVASVEQRSAELQRLMSVLNTLWAVLPSPEARASKLTSANPMSPNPAVMSPRTGRAPGPPLISDADIRSLRTLYDPNGPYLSPASPGQFNIEVFATKVRALIADDRAIVDRLLKFASTHDLLKTNAEKAQKLAQESTISLKTYQDQVQTLEDRNNTLASRQAGLVEEIEQLQVAYDELTDIKSQLEVDAARQADVCAQLTEANATLSARALTLAEESANASAPVVAARAKLESETAELKKKSAELEEELERVRGAEQSQRIALLDELNSMQTENTTLRNQLRALQR